MSAERLSEAALECLPSEVSRPGKRAGVGIVHLGIGAFHRAHQAVYTERAMALTGGDWGICGVSLRSPAVRDSLAPQSGLFTVVVNDAGEQNLEVIGVMREVLVAPENPAAVIARIADPAVQVVTLTITEKGYCLEPASGRLDRRHPDIAHDLEHPDAPRSALGLLLQGLDLRRVHGGNGMTILSCDNLTGNGHRLRAAVLDFAGQLSAELQHWLASQCSFPCSMVDRIVPATSDGDLKLLAQRLGFEDRAAVFTEPFSQWVIEDQFVGPVPDWAGAGAELVKDVAPYEEMKLRLLNASHSTLAYLGNLAGLATVSDTLAAPGFAGLLRRLMAREMAPTLEGLEGFDLQAYQEALLERFANTGLRHATRQIAMDGSQKVPQRLLPAIARQLAEGGDCDVAMLAVAAWMRHIEGCDDQGEDYPVEDPLAERFGQLRELAGDDAAWVRSLLEMAEIFPDELRQQPRFVEGVQEYFGRLRREGAAAVVEQLGA